MDTDGLNFAECTVLLIILIGYIATLVYALSEAHWESRRADYLERSNRELHWEIKNLQTKIK